MSRRSALRCSVAGTIGLLVGCDGSSPAAPSSPVAPTLPRSLPGAIVEPKYERYDPVGVAEASVTITEGRVSGHGTITEADGSFELPSEVGDWAQILVEKPGYESRAATIHRYGPTTTQARLYGPGDPSRIPGTVVIGAEWPSWVWPAFNKMKNVPNRGLLLAVGTPGAPRYSEGVIIMRSDHMHRLDAFVHEAAHFHQSEVRYQEGQWWEDTDEAAEYDAAWELDSGKVVDPETGRRERPSPFDIPYAVINENAAQIVALYLDPPDGHLGHIDRSRYVNRFRWVERYVLS